MVSGLAADSRSIARLLDSCRFRLFPRFSSRHGCVCQSLALMYQNSGDAQEEEGLGRDVRLYGAQVYQESLTFDPRQTARVWSARLGKDAYLHCARGSLRLARRVVRRISLYARPAPDLSCVRLLPASAGPVWRYSWSGCPCQGFRQSCCDVLPAAP